VVQAETRQPAPTRARWVKIFTDCSVGPND
jgi:hypothetical protein